ncbi:hypothetical protein AJ78_04935 [Emergomyces pasteurianus Ep9510]|uniref:NADH dehydrogenase [ubiquinone] 1 beta subcomplex subunit 2 n=1 Tax=Emergomyces pasteurianus Ep9510 TaxID=1447872 RepID=A0A1J9PDZ5_9EURO|nr:hypothetical protein AJ78_04935 [Emergomyces pasteurianus Ep9510]
MGVTSDAMVEKAEVELHVQSCPLLAQLKLSDWISPTMPPNHPIQVGQARPLYRFAATALGASMWFFLMYRAKKDGPALLGWKHPWEH